MENIGIQLPQHVPVKAGQIVTWGVGFIKARVVKVSGQTAQVELLVEAMSPTEGRKFPVGHVDKIDVAHLRLLS